MKAYSVFYDDFVEVHEFPFPEEAIDYFPQEDSG